MRNLILSLIFLALFLTGCARDDRAQAAANLDAGFDAARITMTKITAAPLNDPAALVAARQAAADAVAILDGSRKYIAPTADVPHAEWPAPVMTAKQITENIVAFSSSAPPEPQTLGAGMLTIGATGLAALLWGIGRIAPGVPGLGSGVGMLADAAYSVLAHAKQKEADNAVVLASGAAQEVAPILAMIRTLPAGILPPQIQKELASPIVGAAVDHLTGVFLPPGPALAATNATA